MSVAKLTETSDIGDTLFISSFEGATLALRVQISRSLSLSGARQHLQTLHELN
jgi:hypothetical protein